MQARRRPAAAARAPRRAAGVRAPAAPRGPRTRPAPARSRPRGRPCAACRPRGPSRCRRRSRGRPSRPRPARRARRGPPRPPPRCAGPNARECSCRKPPWRRSAAIVTPGVASVTHPRLPPGCLAGASAAPGQCRHETHPPRPAARPPLLGAGGPRAATLPGICAIRGISYGTAPATGSITVAGGHGCHRFTGAAGDVVRVRLIRTSGTLDPTVGIAPPGGGTGCTAHHRRRVHMCDPDRRPAHAGGPRRRGHRDRNLRASIQRLNDPVGCATLSYATGSTAGALLPGEAGCWRFTGTRPDRVRIRVVARSSALAPQVVVDQRGRSTCPPDAANPTCWLRRGTHTIFVTDAAGPEPGTTRSRSSGSTTRSGARRSRSARRPASAPSPTTERPTATASRPPRATASTCGWRARRPG